MKESHKNKPSPSPTVKREEEKKARKKSKRAEEKLFLQEVRDDYRKFVKKAEAFFSKTETEFRHLKKESLSCLRHMKRELDQHKALLIASRQITETTDDTLCNVLLAIRQNEYLQAYYPEQLGYKAMHVTGTHPAKVNNGKILNEEIT